jgi:hypothetical protein
MLRAIFHPVGREFTPLESFPHIEGEREKRWKKKPQWRQFIPLLQPCAIPPRKRHQNDFNNITKGYF